MLAWNLMHSSTDRFIIHLKIFVYIVRSIFGTCWMYGRWSVIILCSAFNKFFEGELDQNNYTKCILYHNEVATIFGRPEFFLTREMISYLVILLFCFNMIGPNVKIRFLMQLKKSKLKKFLNIHVSSTTLLVSFNTFQFLSTNWCLRKC